MSMEKLYWREEEVISYLEDAITSDTATNYETKFYENYIYSGKFNKESRVYKQIIHNMKQEWTWESYFIRVNYIE